MVAVFWCGGADLTDCCCIFGDISCVRSPQLEPGDDGVVPEHLQGLIGTRPSSSDGTLWEDVVRRWTQLDPETHPQAGPGTQMSVSDGHKIPTHSPGSDFIFVEETPLLVWCPKMFQPERDKHFAQAHAPVRLYMTCAPLIVHQFG